MAAFLRVVSVGMGAAIALTGVSGSASANDPADSAAGTSSATTPVATPLDQSASRAPTPARPVTAEGAAKVPTASTTPPTARPIASNTGSKTDTTPQPTVAAEANGTAATDPTAKAGSAGNPAVVTPSSMPISPRFNAPAQPRSPGSAAIANSANSATVSQSTTSPSTTKPATTIDSLEANPNPLQFPTQPVEVKIQRTQAITLQEAIELARRNNRPLQVSALQLERSRAALKEARAGLFPTVSFQTALTREVSAASELVNTRIQQSGFALSNTGSSNLGIVQGDFNVNRSLSSTLELSYSLFTSGRRDATIKAAAGQVRISELDYETQMEQLRLDITNDYYALQDADEGVRIAKAAVNNAEKSLSDAQALERAGVGTRFAVLQSQVQLANAQQELVRAESQQLVARRQIAQRLSLPQDADVTAADKVDLAGQWAMGLEETIVLAFKNRAELEKQLVQRDVSQQQARAALAAIRPQITAFARYGLANNLDDNTGFDDGYAVGAQFTWNLFDGGAARARVEQQKLNAQIAEVTFADTRNQVRFQVEQAYSNLLSNQKNIDTATLALEQANESLRLARLRFQAGVGTQTEVIDAETQLTRAESNRVRAILDYNRALAALQRATTNLSAAPEAPKSR